MRSEAGATEKEAVTGGRPDASVVQAADHVGGFAGTLVKVLVENGKPVKSGQDLYIIQR